MIIHKCDKCGKLSEQKKTESASTPEGWVSLRLNKGVYSSASAIYEVCSECADALKIPKEYREQVPNIAERLIEILSDIVAEQITQQS